MLVKPLDLRCFLGYVGDMKAPKVIPSSVEIENAGPRRIVWYRIDTGVIGQNQEPIIWEVEYELLRTENGEVATNLRVMANEDGRDGGLSARVLRSVSVDVHKKFPPRNDEASLQNFRNGDMFSLAGIESVRPGRAGRDPEFLARLARRYVEAINAGDRRPIQTLSQWLESIDLPLADETIRGLLKQARNSGLLTDPPRKGVAGGELTEKAYIVLRDARPEFRPNG